MMRYSALALSLLSLITTVISKCDLNPSTYSFTFGNATALVVSDGPTIFNEGEDVVQVPEVSRLRALKENFRTSHPTTLGLNYLLVDTPTNRILVDTGAFNVPEFPDTFSQAGKLFDNLQAAGVSPDSIDSILITHGHADHVGGLAQFNGSPSFPNAMVYIHVLDHEFWMADPIPENTLEPGFLNASRTLYARSILPYQSNGRMVLVDDNSTPLEGVRFMPCRGHSIGHACIDFTSEGERVIYSGDVFRSKWDQVQHPEWTLGIETNSTLGIESRLAFFEQVHDETLLVASHEEFPSMGYIRKLGPFYDWVNADLTQLGTVMRICSQ